VPESSEILFISDLHLDQSNPQITEQFLDFMKTRAANARVLYILGDLFEAWLGDDDPAPAFHSVFEALHFFSQSAELYFMHGNRDFLIGKSLAKRVGFTILNEPEVLQMGSKRVALMHGDSLCTDDLDYQNFRKKVRKVKWQQEFLAKSLPERQSIVADLRKESGEAMIQKDIEIMDVNPNSVFQLMQDLEIDILIHGHTHRPFKHQLPDHKQRIVLGDWQPQASYLSWSDDEFKLVDPRLI
jgi:UDP-2,3-diacylglucosamine hydrolase